LGMKRLMVRGPSPVSATRERSSDLESVIVLILGFAPLRDFAAGIRGKKRLDRSEAKIVDIEVEVLNKVRLCRINKLEQKAMG
jgi:hypothetical protein